MGNEYDEWPGGWTSEQWSKAWTINVGKAYCCGSCGAIVMCTKGGVGVLQLLCCGKDMKLVQEQ